ncbi:MAG: hypothetical protein QXX84_06995 [Sulfolobales archaeon]
MIRTLLTGMAFGIFIGILLSTKCFSHEPVKVVKDTVIVENKIIKVDTLIIKERATQKVIIKDCKYAKIEQTQEEEINKTEKDSAGFFFSQSQTTTSTKTGRFGLGVGLFTSWETWRPSLSFTLSYSPAENVRIQIIALPTQKTVGVNFVGGF